MKDIDNKQVTIFEALDKGEVARAVTNLINGKTPISEIRQRPVVDGMNVNYVNTYYMTRQISLITGFRWESECLEEKVHAANGEPKELGAKMKVTIYDRDGNKYSHISWGSVDIKKKIGYFDQWKAAYSDGIKKCLSYFGIANDVYGGRDLDYFGDEPSVDDMGIVPAGSSSRIIHEQELAFNRYIKDKAIRPSVVCSILSIESTEQITDYKDAYLKVKAHTEAK